ncbi:hypothetical protein G6F24_017553 [Rhizopus arrhizus]|nr:hypothetical protein G6F24_017553 [Rhizopus arrhizus]
MHGGHQAALDAPLVVDDLGQRGQAVGGARGVGDDRLAGVGLVVHAVDEHRRVVLRRGRHDHLLGAGIDVLLRGFLGQEQAGGFQHHVGTDFVPLQVGRVAFLVRRIFLPLTSRSLPCTDTSALKRPCTESYLSMYAR